MKEGQKFVDKHGQLWELRWHIRYRAWFVWNKYAGWGLWNSGRGLTPLPD